MEKKMNSRVTTWNELLAAFIRILDQPSHLLASQISSYLDMQLRHVRPCCKFNFFWRQWAICALFACSTPVLFVGPCWTRAGVLDNSPGAVSWWRPPRGCSSLKPCPFAGWLWGKDLLYNNEIKDKCVSETKRIQKHPINTAKLLRVS